MQMITRSERDYLISQGAKPKTDVFQTYSSAPTYYAKECGWINKLLNDFRKSQRG